MKRKIYTLFAVLMAAAMVLSACASNATQTSASEATTLPPGSVQVNGAGATFPLPIYTEWIYAYQYVDPSVTINYQGIGSGGGKKAIIDNTVDFAGSDSLLSDDEYTSGKDLQMYPMVAGAVVPIYNIEGIDNTMSPLILDRETLSNIYLAKITKWNDPAIVNLNPDFANKLPDKAITTVHRSDGSGTTELFTRALSSFSQEWKDSVSFGTSVEWPADKAGTGVGGKGNQGVAAAVQNTPNSLGYVELQYAVANQITFAQMINKAGNTITANAESLQSAMSDFAETFTDKLTNIIVDGEGAKTWPIAGYTYMILHTTSMQDCLKAQKILEYMHWALTDPGAAQRASSLGYATLPPDVQKVVLDRLSQVTCRGNPVMTMP
jgi:phosphate transport system substrate-binding protein